MEDNLVKIGERFFINGYLTGKINDEKITGRLNEVLKKLFHFQITNKNFYFDLKNENQYDLKPNSWEYDPIFLNLLFNTGLTRVLNCATNQDLILTDIRTRLIKKDKILKPWGYIAPHRDSYFQKEKWEGPVLPSYKLILYPTFNDENHEVLRIYPSSHRKMSKMSNGSLSDRILAFFDSYKKIFKSNNQFCFFSGTLRHWPLKEKSENGSLRVIYVFRDSRYFNFYKDNKITQAYSQLKQKEFSNININVTINETPLKY